MGLDDELIIKNLKIELSEKENTILDLKEKISDLTFKMNVAQNAKIKVESDLRAQIAEMNYLETKVKNTEILEDRITILSAEKKSLENQLLECRTKIDDLKKEKQELGKKIEELEITLDVLDIGDTMQAQVIGGTGIISNSSSLTAFFKNNIKKAKSNIRIVLPDIHDIEKFHIIENLNELPKNVTVSIAAKISDVYSDEFVRELKKNYQLINYEGENVFALNIDSATIGIGITKDKDTLGIFTDSMVLIDLFKSTIMAPFLRGRKVM